MSDLATLQIKVDASGAIRVVDQFGTSVDAAARKTEKLDSQTALLKTGMLQLAGLAGIGSATLALQKFITESSEAQAAQAQLAAVLRSTAGVAGQSAEALNAHATALQRVTTFGDDAVTRAQALLLTFTNIGRETFPAATEAVLDMATAMGGDLRGAAIQLGKALNDPVGGIAALNRVGVQFTDGQKALIASLVETNQLAAAQRVILAELETQMGGSARAARDTLGGAITALGVAFGNLFEASREGSGGFIEVLDRITRGLDRAGEAMDRYREKQANFNAFVDNGGVVPAPPPDPVTGFTVTPVSDTSWTRNAPRTTSAGTAADAQRTRDADAAVAAMLEQHYRDSAAALAFRMQQEEDAADARTQAARDADAAVRAVEEQHYRDSAEALRNRLEAERDGLRTLTESARVFKEQSQLALARFASDFLKDGLGSLDNFWDSFLQLGRDALGNIFAREVMEGLGAELSATLKDALADLGLDGKAGGMLAGFGQGIISALDAAAKSQARTAELMAASARSIAAFGRRAGDADLTDEQRRLRDLTDERDALARSAVKAAGVSGFTGGYAEAFDVLRAFPFLTNLREQILDIGEAYAANTEAIRKNIAALEQEKRERQSATLAQFRDSLALSGQSILSPVQQLAEARRQYDAILALAEGGDASAIDSLPETARTLLDAARAVFASGARYADEFNRVNADVAAIMETLKSVAPPPSGDGGGVTWDGGPPDPEPVEPPDWWAEGPTWYAEPPAWWAGAGPEAIAAAIAASLAVQQEGFTQMVAQMQGVQSAINDMKSGVVNVIEETAF